MRRGGGGMRMKEGRDLRAERRKMCVTASALAFPAQALAGHNPSKSWKFRFTHRIGKEAEGERAGEEGTRKPTSKPALAPAVHQGPPSPPPPLPGEAHTAHPDGADGGCQAGPTTSATRAAPAPSC